MLSLSDICKELFTEKTRTILTILAIAWGTFAIAIMLSIGEGLRLTFAETLQNTGYNLLVLGSGETSKAYRGSHPNIDINFKKETIESLAKLPNVAQISPQYNMKGLGKYQDQEHNIAVQAVADNFASIHSIPIQAGGRFINQDDLAKRRSVIVLGKKAREFFFKKQANPVGKQFYIDNQPFLIIGVMEDKSQIMASEAPDSDYNWIPYTTYELMKNPTQVDSISITYKNPEFLSQTKRESRTVLALESSAAPDDESIVDFSEFEKQQEKVNTFFIGMQIFLGIVGFLTLVVAGVGIANVMYASVKRATHEIGLRMALGARSFQILVHYIAGALVATFLGGALGLFFTYIAIYAIKTIPMQGRLIETIGKPKPVLSLLVIFLVITTLGVIGFLAGFFPALKASKIDPSEALIYE
ncbi:MAG: ABC transporter permease [Gammaproteobacteria bacterium]